MATLPAPPPLAGAGAVPFPDEHSVVIPILEETATVACEVVKIGRVRLTKTVRTHEEVLPLDLRHEEVTVERVALNQLLPEGAPVPIACQQGDALIIPVLREVTVTRLVLVEEVHVTTRHVTTQQPQTILGTLPGLASRKKTANSEAAVAYRQSTHEEVLRVIAVLTEQIQAPRA